MTAFVSNGNGTPRCSTTSGRGSISTRSISRASTTGTTASLAGASQPILDTIRALHELGIWLEIVTLLIPGFNDSPDEIERLTAFLAGVSPDIPWHVTAFHKDYRMTDPANTTPEMLVEAAAIGARNGLRYVYAGNLPGTRRRSGEHALPHLPRAARRAVRLFRAALPADAGWTLPGLRHDDPGPLGRRLRGQITVHAVLPGPVRS